MDAKVRELNGSGRSEAAAIYYHTFKLDPIWDGLRQEPRFVAVLERLNALRTNPASSSEAARSPFPDSKSIAVLPFANLSPDPENAFFADGVHEDVITNLAKIHDLKVISRTSTLAYRETAQRSLRQIATELGVAAVLEGDKRGHSENREYRSFLRGKPASDGSNPFTDGDTLAGSSNAR